MIQAALRAEDVQAEEEAWSAVISRFETSIGKANWAADAVGRAYGNRGNCLARQGKFQAAISDYNKSIELCPYSVDPVLNRGVAFEGIREYELAIQDYRAVLDGSPSDPAAWNNFGNANAALQNWDVALDAFSKAIAMSNFDAQAAGSGDRAVSNLLSLGSMEDTVTASMGTMKAVGKLKGFGGRSARHSVS